MPQMISYLNVNWYVCHRQVDQDRIAGGDLHIRLRQAETYQRDDPFTKLMELPLYDNSNGLEVAYCSLSFSIRKLELPYDFPPLLER
jgi:hypothetical protein